MRLFLYLIFFFSAIISSTPSYSIDELSNYREKCKVLGFSEGTEKFGDCVLNLLDKFPSLKIDIVKLNTGEPGSLIWDTLEQCVKAGTASGQKVYYFLFFEGSKCPTTPKYFTGFAGSYNGKYLQTLYEVVRGVAVNIKWFTEDNNLYREEVLEKGLTAFATSYFFDSEKVNRITPYRAGVPHGVEKIYLNLNENLIVGEGLEYSITWNNGELDGPFKKFNYRGELYEVIEYKDGEEISTECVLGVWKDACIKIK